MENKKSVSTGITILIAILVVCVLGMGSFIVYDKAIINNGKVNTNNSNQTNDKKEENGVSSKDYNSEKNINNSYELFAENLKAQISKIYNENNDGKIFSWNDKYSIEMDKNRSLYITYQDANLNKKFGKYKLVDNILGYYVVQTGQGGGNTLYFINENGTVGSADIEYGVIYSTADVKQIPVKKDLGYKNIVAIVEAGFGVSTSGTSEAIFIDINGNMFSSNLK